MSDNVADSIDGSAVEAASQDAKQFASELMAHWPKEAPFDARVVLEQHPELHDYKSIVIDLAYEEYCRQVEAGVQVAPDEFAQRFPSVQRSLMHLLEVDQFLDLAGELPRDQAAIQWPEAGETFLDFTLVESLGRGAFSRVYLAHEKTLGNRTVVVKICYRGGQEANTLGKLQHPNIVSVYSVHEDPQSGLTAICMPYWGRATLTDVLDAVFADRAPISPGQVIPAGSSSGNSDVRIPALKKNLQSIFRRGSYLDAILEIGAQLADGLAFTHKAGIFHRDIKPSNALITEDGRALLLDFNLSSSEMNESWMVAGTLPYMAPEQLQAVCSTIPNREHTFDARTDLFQLGVMLYELLAGHSPFGRIDPSASLREMAAALLERQRGGPHPLIRANPQIDRKLAKLIESTLATDPELRPTSAQVFAQSLRSHLSRRRRLLRWSKRHPWRMAAMVFGVVLAVSAATCAIAMIPPDRVREEKRGWIAFERGNNEAAVTHFSRVLKVDPANPENWDIRFARGRAYASAGQFELAHADFKWLDEHQVADGRVSACIGYCLCRMNSYHQSAIISLKRAIELGFANAAVYNDLGFCYSKTSQPKEAEAALREALALDGKSQAVYLNLALLELRAAHEKRRCPDVTSMEKAIESGPTTAELEFHAAGMFALAAMECPSSSTRSNSTYLDAAIDACQKAIALGMDPAKINGLGGLYPILAEDARFQTIGKSKETGRTTGAQPEIRIVDPLLGAEHVSLRRSP